MEKRTCSWNGCKTEINLDTTFEQSGVGRMMGVVVSGWCELHSELYNKQCDAFTKLLDKWNKKQIENKFGKIRKFTHHSDLSNYLYQYNRKEYNKIIKGVKV